MSYASHDGLPLAGIRVIEFSHMVMGPAGGLVLADLGAEVIRVEPIAGDKTRTLKGSGAGYFAMYNRNKKSIRLNLKTEGGIEVARRLVSGADVLIENFRPGAMDRLGLDYESLSADNPGLIYCSAHGFLKGPYEQRTALDEVAQMMGGLTYMTGPPGRPLRAGASVIDVMGGVWGAIGILVIGDALRMPVPLPGSRCNLLVDPLVWTSIRIDDTGSGRARVALPDRRPVDVDFQVVTLSLAVGIRLASTNGLHLDCR